MLRNFTDCALTLPFNFRHVTELHGLCYNTFLLASGMSRNFTNCLMMGAKYLEVVKRGSHPKNGWSPDEIRGSKDKTLISFERNTIRPTQNDHNLSLHFVGHDRAWAARHRMTIICLCVPLDTIASEWQRAQNSSMRVCHSTRCS
ncbi:hypothetical protein HKD37_16G045069 [Glycine soja]